MQTSHKQDNITKRDYQRIIREGIMDSHDRYCDTGWSDTSYALSGVEKLMPLFTQFLRQKKFWDATLLLTTIIETSA